jgi:glycolate oxidase iron-sulfur subunit
LSDDLRLVEAVSDELDKCNRCGFCQTRCPVYRMTGRESSVARGHLARLRAALRGEIPFDDEIRSSLFECLMCRACTAECPPAIETDRAVVAARASYVAQGQPLLQRLAFRTVLANPALLRAAVRAIGWAKRTRLLGAAKLASALGGLPWLDRGYLEAPGWMPTPKSFLRERLARRAYRRGVREPRVPPAGFTKPAPTPTKTVGYFVGCAIDCGLPEIGEATLDLLEATGHRVLVADNVCCGLPPFSYGDLASARALARKNIDALNSAGADEIITDCASCSSFLREYPELFDEADPTREAAARAASRVRELAQFLAEVELPVGLQEVRAVVTYHDPCHLSRYQGVTREPRDLIRRIPGVEYRELPEADWCCGGAGSYSLSHYDLSMRILERKMSNIRATGAQMVVTPCPACIMQLRYGAGKFGVPVEVIHLTELLKRALPATAGSGRSG